MSRREVTPADERSPARERVDRELLGEHLTLEREVDRLDAMSSPVRLTILYLLVEDGGRSSGALADALDRRQNDLYYHLNALEDAGLVLKRRVDGDRVYELTPGAERFVPVILDAIRERAEAR